MIPGISKDYLSLLLLKELCFPLGRSASDGKRLIRQKLLVTPVD
jgi:hypothetical protein